MDIRQIILGLKKKMSTNVIDSFVDLSCVESEERKHTHREKEKENERKKRQHENKRLDAY